MKIPQWGEKAGQVHHSACMLSLCKWSGQSKNCWLTQSLRPYWSFDTSSRCTVRAPRFVKSEGGKNFFSLYWIQAPMCTAEKLCTALQGNNCPVTRCCSEMSILQAACVGLCYAPWNCSQMKEETHRLCFIKSKENDMVAVSSCNEVKSVDLEAKCICGS